MRLIHTLYEPNGDGPHPTLIAMHGFGASALDLLGLAPYIADGRFMGQGFDLVVSLPDGPYDDGPESRRRLTAAFETAYREKFALTPPGVPVEFLNIRVAVRAPVSGSEVVGAATMPPVGM